MAEKAKEKSEKTTEKEDSPKSSSKDAMGSMWSFSRSALPYLIAALVAATATAWYFFVFVPGKLEYFVSLRFRTLAVASGHIQNKVENLAKALAIVPTGTGDPCTTLGDKQIKYVGQVLPDIQVDKNNRPPPRVFVCPSAERWQQLPGATSSARARQGHIETSTISFWLTRTAT